MTTNNLIEKANKLAQQRVDCFTEDCVIGSEAYDRAVTKMHNISSFAEYHGVICESTVNFKGNTLYYSNRFYVRKEDGNRGIFSKSKSVLKIG